MALQDLTAYTEVDTSGFMAVAANSATLTDMLRAPQCSLYKDFGVDYFTGVMEIEVKAFITIPAALGGPWRLVLSNATDASGVSVAIEARTNSSANIYWRIALDDGTSQVFELYQTTNYTYDTGYLTLRVNPAAGTNGEVYLDIYSDAARTTLVSTVTAVWPSAVAMNFRYLHAVQNQNDGNTDNARRVGPATISDLDIVSVGSDTQAPTVSNVALVATAATTITVSADTDEAGGNMVARAYADGATPIDADVIAGTGALGSSAAYVPTAGSNTLPPITGLTAATPYEVFVFQIDDATNESNVVQLTGGATTAAADVTAPTVTSVAVSTSGLTVTVTFDEPVANSTGLSLTADAVGVTLSSPVVSSNTITYTTTQIYQGATCLLSYTPGNIEDLSANALVAFSDTAVTNNSTVVNDTTAPVLTVPGATVTSTTVTGFVTSDEAGGTIYCKVYDRAVFSAASPPTKTQFYTNSPTPSGSTSKAGEVGVNNFSTIPGFNTSTPLTVVFGQVDGSSNQADLLIYEVTTLASGDTTAPVLSDGVANVVNDTVSLGVVTNETGGLLFMTLYPAAVIATVANVKAPLASAISTASTSPFAGYVPFPTEEALEDGASLTAHFVHEDGAGNDSNLLSVPFTVGTATGTGATAEDVLALLVSQDYASTVAASVYAELIAQGFVAKVDGLTSGTDTADAVYAKLEAMSLITKIDETWKMQGLDPNDPLVVTRQSRVSGDINQLISGDGRTLGTVTRQP